MVCICSISHFIVFNWISFCMFYMDLKMMDPYAFFGLFYMFAYAVHGFEKPCVIIASEPLLRTYVFTLTT